MRDGAEVVVDQSEVVKDDIVILRAGDQAVVDGTIVSCRSLEMDESLLTGESSTVRKNAGDTIYSGSNCVTGEAHYTVTGFGAESYASKMLSSAKKYTVKRTPLQMETGTVTKVLMAIAAVLFVITIIKSIFVTHESFGEMLEVFVLCLDVVPIALFLLITLTVKKIGQKSARHFLQQQIKLGKLNGYIEEMIEGQKVVKVFCHEERAKDLWTRSSSRRSASTAPSA